MYRLKQNLESVQELPSPIYFFLFCDALKNKGSSSMTSDIIVEWDQTTQTVFNCGHVFCFCRWKSTVA